jgi:hypothetical protein
MMKPARNETSAASAVGIHCLRRGFTNAKQVELSFHTLRTKGGTQQLVIGEPRERRRGPLRQNPEPAPRIRVDSNRRG